MADPTTAVPTAPLSEENNGQIYLGVILAVIGNILISCALNVQKYSHNKNAASETKKQYIKRPLWWAGMLLMLFGELGNFLAYGMASASLIAPLGTVALVTNALIAPFVLKERFRTQDLIGIVIAIGGAIVVVMFAPSSEPDLTPEELAALFKATKMIVYMCISAVLAGVLAFLSPRYSHKTLTIDMALVGIFGGYTIVATKAVSTLLQHDPLKMFTLWLFYVMLILMIVTGVLQVRYLQNALQNYDSTEVIPTQFVMFTLGALITSGMLYDDFKGMEAVDVIVFCVGCCLTFLGVYCITYGRARKGAAGDLLAGGIDDTMPIVESESEPMLSASVPEDDEPPQQDTTIHKAHELARNLVNLMVMGARARTHTQKLEFAQVNRNYANLEGEDEEYSMASSVTTRDSWPTTAPPTSSFQDASPAMQHVVSAEQDRTDASQADDSSGHVVDAYSPQSPRAPRRDFED